MRQSSNTATVLILTSEMQTEKDLYIETTHGFSKRWRDKKDNFSSLFPYINQVYFTNNPNILYIPLVYLRFKKIIFTSTL